MALPAASSAPQRRYKYVRANGATWAPVYEVHDRLSVSFGCYESKEHAAFAVNVGLSILHAAGMYHSSDPVNIVGGVDEEDKRQVGYLTLSLPFCVRLSVSCRQHALHA